MATVIGLGEILAMMNVILWSILTIIALKFAKKTFGGKLASMQPWIVIFCGLILFYCIWIVSTAFIFGVELTADEGMMVSLESLPLMAGVALLIAGSNWYYK